MLTPMEAGSWPRDVARHRCRGAAHLRLSLLAPCCWALYNGEADTPKQYRNDDENDDKRVFWSRNDHMVVFDDTKGAEQVGVGACASDRLDVTSAPIHHVLDAAEKTLTEKCDGVTLYEAKRSVNIRCKTFSLECDNLLVDAGSLSMAKEARSRQAASCAPHRPTPTSKPARSLRHPSGPCRPPQRSTTRGLADMQIPSFIQKMFGQGQPQQPPPAQKAKQIQQAAEKALDQACQAIEKQSGLVYLVVHGAQIICDKTIPAKKINTLLVPDPRPLVEGKQANVSDVVVGRTSAVAVQVQAPAEREGYLPCKYAPVDFGCRATNQIVNQDMPNAKKAMDVARS